MGMLSFVVLALLLLIVLLVIAAAQMPADYMISESIVINRPVDKVFDFVKQLRHADRYNKWTMLDPRVKRSFIGTDGTVGFVASWDSEIKQVGRGEQEIMAIEEGCSIEYEIRFEKPFNNVATAHLSTTPLSETRTQVDWAFGGKRTMSMKVVHLLFNLPEKLRRDLSESLHTLKRIMET